MPVNGYNFWAGGSVSSIGNVGAVHLCGLSGSRAAYVTMAPPFGPGPNPMTINVWDFSLGTPGGPTSSSSMDVSSISSASQYAPYTIDANGILWGVSGDAGSSSTNWSIEAHDINSGSHLGSTDSSYNCRDFEIWSAQAYRWNGEAYIAVWWAHHDATLLTEDYVFLEVYNVDSGSPSSMGSVTIDLDPVRFMYEMVTNVFFDGQRNLYVMRIQATATVSDPDTGDPIGDFSSPPNGELFQIDAASMAFTSSTFSGTYAFIGDPATGHVNLIGTDGSLREVDASFSTVSFNAGLVGAWDGLSNDLDGVPPMNFGYPFFTPRISNAMRNPLYGVSFDPITGQFLTFSAVTFVGPGLTQTLYTIRRVVDYTVDTIAQCYTDWGTEENSTFFFEVFLYARQSLLHNSSDANGLVTPGADLWEFMFTPISTNPCAGVTAEFR